MGAYEEFQQTLARLKRKIETEKLSRESSTGKSFHEIFDKIFNKSE